MKAFRKLIFLGICSLVYLPFSDVSAQVSDSLRKEEMVPVVIPEKPDFSQWMVQELPLWGGICQFPDTPYYALKEIYTEKGLVPEKNFKWEDYEQSILLEISSYKLPEKLNVKNEKKLVDAAAQRYAIVHGGYPELSNSSFNTAPGIKVYDLEIKTLKKQLFRARIFMEGEQIMIFSALIMQSGTLPRAQAKHFLESMVFNPLPGEITTTVQQEKKNIFNKPVKDDLPWESLDAEQFSALFPKYPVSQHRLIKGQDTEQRYYEWYVADGDKGTTYLLAITPVEKQQDWTKILSEGIESTTSITGSSVVARRTLDFFIYPCEEVVMKTKQQSFRVRFFTDGQYLYQMVVGGNESNIFDTAANKFLDSLKWR
jgi:hypothetical protein